MKILWNNLVKEDEENIKRKSFPSDTRKNE